MASKKILSTLIITTLVLVIIALITGIVMQILPTIQKSSIKQKASQPTQPAPVENGIKKYYSTDYEFGFSYPQNWRLVVNPNMDKGGTIQLFDDVNNIKIETALLTKTQQDMNLAVFVKQQIYTGLNAGQEHTTLDTKLGERIAISDEPKNNDSYKSYYVDLYADKVLVVSVFPQTSGKGVDEILKSYTFKRD